MSKKYHIIARNYDDGIWQFEKRTNSLLLARIIWWYACWRWNIVHCDKLTA